jgi:DNA helicase-4
MNIVIKRTIIIKELISNKYINLQEQELLFKQSSLNKKILKKIEEHNTNYINETRKKLTILNNINGYPLDEYQSRVVLSNELATLVIAGAGSGKSLTIIGKIVYLVKICNINPNDILCISFTNDATINLKNNIKKTYNFDIDIYTFHKLSLTILNSHNIEYKIANEDLLNSIVDTFFNETIPSNKIYQKALRYVIGKSPKEKELINLKRLITTFINLFKSNNQPITYYLTILKRIKFTLNIKEYIKHKYLILLIFNIHILYEEELKQTDSIDFNDMINNAINTIEKYGLKKKWKYVIVDEYQDTSLTKFNLIKKIIDISEAKFLAVGDDFQSIYRFTGCNLHIFLNFTKYFNYSKIMPIVNTYRNPQELINIAGKFIMKNKYQQRKNLVSNKHLSNPIIIYYSNDKIKSLKEILTTLELQNSKEILVLGRNNKDIISYIDNTYKQDKDIYTYNNISFRYLTIHKSKGLESDNVILINIEDKLLGLPTKIKDEKILKHVNNTKDYYPYEEERRLFYVALTRTKNKTYIISPYKNESIFIKEIKKYKGVKQIKK